jgi:hypothetical protein
VPINVAAIESTKPTGGYKLYRKTEPAPSAAPKISEYK